MKRYDSYKDSGVEWLGNIPSSWNKIKLKHKGDVIIGLSYKPDDVVNENEGTLVMRSSNVQNGKPTFNDNVYVQTEISDKLTTKEGDILICSRNGSRRLIGKNCLITKDIEGMTWGVFMTIYRSPYSKYMYWLLNSPIFKSQSGLFLTSTINQLTVSTLENMVLPFTENIDEQQQIVSFLDTKTSLIDSLIEKTQRKIELIKEKRTSLINEVVTKGLNPNVEMKDSGVEWIGEIPDGWLSIPLKYFLEKNKDSIRTGPFGSTLKSSDMIESGIRIYNQRTVYDEDFSSGEIFVSDEKYQTMKSFTVLNGDILISSRGTIGKMTIVPEGSDIGVLHPCLIRLRIDQKKMNKQFLWWYMNHSSLFLQSVKFESNSTTIDVIYSNVLSEVKFPVPTLIEQEEIVSFLSQKIGVIDKTISIEEKRIKLLKEYRQSLISEVVTGKRKVV
jgi:type I restriction enzyme S subunit